LTYDREATVVEGVILGMPSGQFIDVLQSAILVILILGLIYIIAMVRREMRETAAALREVLHRQQSNHEAIERLWRRIEAVEMRQGINTDVEALARLKRLVDAMETALRPDAHH
jgi:hypothetical protein